MQIIIPNKNRTHHDKEAAFKAMRKEEMVRITFAVPKSLRDKVKIKVIQNHTNMTDMLINCMKKYME